ncbi:PAS domain-containing protein [Aurantiacibacter sediminis]|uniref:PAS domain-containing protein n=1 Tax=Aurantiacibacter sediminis TaxID=2793064 RepID=UPI0018D61D45|nr:PAS domain-containing protein [Aurantiacibacter sediminis]
MNDTPDDRLMPEPDPRFVDDAARLAILESFQPDALEEDPELAAIVQFAARLCNVPIAQVSLVEETRQHFLAGEGLDVTSTPRRSSFCKHAMKTPGLMEVRDATKDERFADNDLVTGKPHIRFYGGQPLISDEGAPLGALCVIDTEPRPEGLSDLQREGMAVLAQAVMRRLNARRESLAATRAIAEREGRLKRMIDGVPQIAWSADANGNFDYFNSRWQERIGTEPPTNAEAWRSYIHAEDQEEAFSGWHEAFEQGEQYSTEFRMKQSDGSWRWMLALAVPVTDADDHTMRWFGTITDIDEVQKALHERDMLARELSHRIKNIFAVVIGLASLKVKRTPEHEPFARELTEVMRALSRAHEFVRPESGVVQQSLTGLLTALFQPYAFSEDEPRVSITGSDAEISQKAATPLALVFHELATNSAKYGALSTDDGHVTLVVEDRGDTLALTWTEIGGPKVSASGKEGFGTRLLEMSVSGQLGGSIDRQYHEDGLVAALTVSKKAISQ